MNNFDLLMGAEKHKSITPIKVPDTVRRAAVNLIARSQSDRPPRAEMSEEKKDAYEVGIPLDELPPQELSAETDEASIEDEGTMPLADAENELPDAPEGLPDLFDPEELAEVGLTAELSDADDNPEDDDNASPFAPDEDGAEERPADSALREEAETDPGVMVAEDPAEDPMDDGAAQDADRADQFPSEMIIAQPPDDEAATAAEDVALVDAEIETGTIEVEPRTDTGLPGESEFTDPDLLMGRLESLGLQISELQREFEGKLKYDAHKDEIIDRLHSELQEYKQDIIKKYVLSIVMDVVKVADDIRKWLAYFRSLEVSQRDPRKLFRYLEAIPSDLEDVFYWHGVKPFSHQEGDFDPSRQRAIKKIPTADPALDKSVAHSIRPGYEWETKVIRQEMVAVYVYQEEQESLDTGMIDE